MLITVLWLLLVLVFLVGISWASLTRKDPVSGRQEGDGDDVVIVVARVESDV